MGGSKIASKAGEVGNTVSTKASNIEMPGYHCNQLRKKMPALSSNTYFNNNENSNRIENSRSRSYQGRQSSSKSSRSNSNSKSNSELKAKKINKRISKKKTMNNNQNNKSKKDPGRSKYAEADIDELSQDLNSFGFSDGSEDLDKTPHNI